jgi:hypothetical protein
MRLAVLTSANRNVVYSISDRSLLGAYGLDSIVEAEHYGSPLFETQTHVRDVDLDSMVEAEHYYLRPPRHMSGT